MKTTNTYYSKVSRKLLNPEEREMRYGWISRKYNLALSALAGNEVEVKDGFGTGSEPVIKDPDAQFSEEVTLSIEDIIDIHDKMVDDYGGEYGLRDDGLLEGIRDAPYTKFFGQEQYPDILDKAAKYLFDFTYYQVFVDGNKRVGLSVANAYLAANGLSLTLSVTKAYELVMSIANHGFENSEELVPILKENIKAIE